MKQKLIFLMMCLAFTLSAVGQGIVTRQKPNGGRTLSATVTRSGDNLVLKVGMSFPIITLNFAAKIWN